MQLTSNSWSKFPFWKRFIADGDVTLKFQINFWTNLLNMYMRSMNYKKSSNDAWQRMHKNINYISYILCAKWFFKCFSVRSIETQFKKRTYTRFVIACVCTATCWLNNHLNRWIILSMETLASPMICLRPRQHSHA